MVKRIVNPQYYAYNIVIPPGDSNVKMYNYKVYKIIYRLVWEIYTYCTD